MYKTTPFHERLTELNTQGLYTHWHGHLSALRYSHAPKHEYFAVRNSVGVFDTSPLFKYRITGPDAERLLAGVLTRDIRSCRLGHAHYTLWCDDRGFVMEDGVAFRHATDDFLLTTARPNLGWFRDHGRRLRVEVEDVTDDFGILAVQGPRSARVLDAVTDGVHDLGFFDHAQVKIAGTEVTLSRTGYTGDLGYEITAPADRALDVLDAVLEAGEGHGMRPFGEEALTMLRIEAGLPLVDVEWQSSRTAFSDEQRVTPKELGLGWMLKGVRDGDRAFVGGAAIRRELVEGTSRWASVGIVVDWRDWDRLHREAGLFPPKDEHPLPYESMVYDADGTELVGYATSFMYSPVLQRHLGLARVLPDLAPTRDRPGAGVRLEISLLHRTTTVAATTTRAMHFDPPRKTARTGES
ncbi:aminomethyltransferase family protein [Nocardioides coralli]|uniref:aminomethyltransferase family protein n=1 Tax=Nocardioides coralli TaxID=2872154 RepID=UPI001CA45E0F|nr:aminomethyltransferase family protein [Nocardioides coralli]QZY28348.1 aminomethyltransferase family protein [Nocardioides coralli]